MASLSSLIPSPHFYPKNHFHTPARVRTLSFFSKFDSNSHNYLVKEEKKSFAVATGELFLGLASRLIKVREGKTGESSPAILSQSRIGSVVEQGEVVWEQRVEDVKAEKGRTNVTSPGFSFSAAGLLFPYHLGAAQLLIEDGYIKETTPLAGSSAGAIVCAVIASGNSMQDALKATKILAADCRLKGTAFRLGWL